jgi:trigger factor
MQVTEVANIGLRRAYQVVVPADDIAAQHSRRLAELGRTVRLPGFRPGKVPPKVIASRYGQAVMGEVLEQSVNQATQQVVTDRGLRPALQPKIEVLTFADGTDLEFKVELEIMPEVPMPDFSGIALERVKAEPDEAEVSKTLDTLAARNRRLEDIEETRGAAPGEVVVCDFTGRRIGEDGAPEAAPIPGGSGTDFPIEIGGRGMVPGFAEQLEGIAPGETRTISITFPQDYGDKDIAGRAAMFEVTAKALKRPVTPPLDDALASELGFGSLDELRTMVRTQIQREYDSLARMRVKRALLDALAARADFPVPEGMVEAEFAQIWQRVEADLKTGQQDEDDKGKEEGALKAEYRAIAERRVRLGLLLSEIGRTNSIAVSAEELGRAMRQEAARYPGQEQQVMEFFRRNPQAADGLRSPIFEDKVVDFMLELAQVTERTVTPEEMRMSPVSTPEVAPSSPAS